MGATNKKAPQAGEPCGAQSANIRERVRKGWGKPYKHDKAIPMPTVQAIINQQVTGKRQGSGTVRPDNLCQSLTNN
jgi:hypothetical protein